MFGERNERKLDTLLWSVHTTAKVMSERSASPSVAQVPRLPEAHIIEPILQCGVLYLGTALPSPGRRGLDSVQEPLSHRYPIDGTNTARGTARDWASVAICFPFIARYRRDPLGLWQWNSISLCSSTVYRALLSDVLLDLLCQSALLHCWRRTNLVSRLALRHPRFHDEFEKTSSTLLCRHATNTNPRRRRMPLFHHQNRPSCLSTGQNGLRCLRVSASECHHSPISSILSSKRRSSPPVHSILALSLSLVRSLCEKDQRNNGDHLSLAGNGGWIIDAWSTGVGSELSLGSVVRGFLLPNGYDGDRTVAAVGWRRSNGITATATPVALRTSRRSLSRRCDVGSARLSPSYGRWRTLDEFIGLFHSIGWRSSSTEKKGECQSTSSLTFPDQFVRSDISPTRGRDTSHPDRHRESPPESEDCRTSGTGAISSWTTRAGRTCTRAWDLSNQWTRREDHQGRQSHSLHGCDSSRYAGRSTFARGAQRPCSFSTSTPSTSRDSYHRPSKHGESTPLESLTDASPSAERLTPARDRDTESSGPSRWILRRSAGKKDQADGSRGSNDTQAVPIIGQETSATNH